MIRRLGVALDVGGLALCEHLDLERIELSTLPGDRDTLSVPFEVRSRCWAVPSLMASYHDSFEALAEEARRTLPGELAARSEAVQKAVRALSQPYSPRDPDLVQRGDRRPSLAHSPHSGARPRRQMASPESGRPHGDGPAGERPCPWTSRHLQPPSPCRWLPIAHRISLDFPSAAVTFIMQATAQRAPALAARARRCRCPSSPTPTISQSLCSPTPTSPSGRHTTSSESPWPSAALLADLRGHHGHGDPARAPVVAVDDEPDRDVDQPE